MGVSSEFLATLVLALVSSVANGDPLVPALIIFGASVVDVGNNNNLNTPIKANFPPYGRDFVTHSPTGRFCNGKLATTSLRSITLTQQLTCYKECQTKVENMVGKPKANDIFSGAIHLLSAGSSDYIQNYYINPLLNRIYTPDQFSDILMRSYSSFIQNLYGLGARKIGGTTLPPSGYLPAAITLFGGGRNGCVARLNQDAIAFNNKLNSTSLSLQNKFPELKLVVFDIYQPLLDMVTKPSDNGKPPIVQKSFFESRRACCGTGTLDTSLLCNAKAHGTCSNATSYVFWDGFHPSQAVMKS
ncbi:GDSL esterase/lipase At5g03810-like [Hibiscus syriacus]|uniref:GDSL esterase/lipase At5g03810-like n=1 Tax=Hibiscus syriacus TaxID=106335 RepID=UPI001921165A|nr:GDSL esterase/lipase At5g03810-like [Hibiscus syriacus]